MEAELTLGSAIPAAAAANRRRRAKATDSSELHQRRFLPRRAGGCAGARVRWGQGKRGRLMSDMSENPHCTASPVLPASGITDDQGQRSCSACAWR